MFPGERRIDLISFSFFKYVIFINAAASWAVGLGVIFLTAEKFSLEAVFRIEAGDLGAPGPLGHHGNIIADTLKF